MCNLYEYDMTPEVMQSLKVDFGMVGNGYLDVLGGRNGPQEVCPNYEAPVIRSLATPDGVVRDIVPMRWGFPPPPFYQRKANFTNVRNTASGCWKPYLKAGQRCLVPATAFSEPDRNTSKPVVFRWFARPDGALFYFAGIWREWEGNRGTKKAPNVGRHLLFSFLTTEPNGIVEPLHDKAMPVLIRTKDEAWQWLEAPPDEAMRLQKPAPDDAVVLLPLKREAA